MSKHPVTIFLILLNVVVFSVFAITQQTVMFSSEDDFLQLFLAGANFNPFTLDGQPWRLFTSMFMHANIFHLGVNMYGLYVIGRDVEQRIGAPRFFLVYMIAGVVGGLFSISFDLFTNSVGASGSVFGLYGFQLIDALVFNKDNRDVLVSIVVNFLIFVAVNTGIALMVNSGADGLQIDTNAHIGGGVAGAALAGWYSSTRFFTPLTLTIALIGVFMLNYVLPKDQVEYYKAYQSVVEAEHFERNIFRQNLSDHQITDSLKEKTSKWDVIRQKLDSLPYVSEDLRHDTMVIRRYAALRKQLSHYVILQVEKESYTYLDSQDIVNERLEALPKIQHYIPSTTAGSESPPEQPTEEAPVYESAQVFYDSNWREVPEYLAVYFRIGARDSLKRWQGKVRDYYGDNTIQMKGAYKDGLSHGVFLYYSHDKKYQSAGRYDLENPVGKWEEFHQNGKLHREVMYGDRVMVRTVYDTTGSPQVVNGNGQEISYHTNGVVKEQGGYQNGRREGIWKGYHPNGKQYFEELYRDNLLVRGLSIDPSGGKHTYDQSSFYPNPQIGLKAYQDYLAKNIRKDHMSRMREGVVKLVFSVDKDGTLHDFVVLKSLCTTCDAEAIRLVQQGPAWRPALIRGHEKATAKSFIDVNF